MPDRILVIAGGAVADELAGGLRREGFDVETSPTGEAGVSSALNSDIFIVVCDLALPDIDGQEVCRRLKADPQARGIPLVLIIDSDVVEGEISDLVKEVDDLIVRPYSPGELLARVHLNVERAAARYPTDPVTGLPGNVSSDAALKDKVGAGAPFAMLLIAVCGLTPFREAYDDERFEQVIRFTADTVKEVVDKQGSRHDHAAYLGNGTFSIITVPERAETLARSIIRLFDEGIRQFYSAGDAERGCVTTFDRRGGMIDNPIMTVSVGIASNANRVIRSHWEAATIAREVLNYAMTFPQSKYHPDRRTGGGIGDQ